MIFCTIIAGNSFSSTTVHQNSRQFTVVIDPGHGGNDPGAVSKNIREKDVVLGIGLKLGKLISENNPEVKVIFTRNTDVFIPLIDRSRIANKSKADLFISIHANICATPSTRGTETFFLGPAREGENFDVAKKENSVILLEDDYSTTYEGFDPNSSESYIMFEMAQSAYLKQSLYFADDIQHQFKSRNDSPNRGVKQAGFLVLRMSSMPSVLIETGFISNPTEANYLNSEEGQQHIAFSVYEAFKKFKNKTSGTVAANTPEVIASHQKNQEPSSKQEVHAENQKAAEKKKVEVDSTINSQKAGPEKVETTSLADSNMTVKTKANSKKAEPEKVETSSSSDSNKAVITNPAAYYSVQIAASITSMEPNAGNFKGLKDVRREKDDKYYRYYIGNEDSVGKLTNLFKQAKLKFPQAFIVSFVNGKRIPLIGVLK
jgi:N-acetylmuramoyl-L-alanine amidase